MTVIVPPRRRAGEFREREIDDFFPLPPAPALELSGARQALLEQATLAFGQLDSIALLLSDPQLFCTLRQLAPAPK